MLPAEPALLGALHRRGRPLDERTGRLYGRQAARRWRDRLALCAVRRGGTRTANATCLANREDEQRRHLAQLGGRAVHVARCSTDPPSRKRHDEKRRQRDARYGDYGASPVEQAQEKRSQRPDGQVSESTAWIE